MTTKKEKTFIGHVAQRIPVDDAHPYGIMDVTKIPPEEPCIVAIGGGKTTTIRDANYYASMIRRVLAAYDVTGVNIYSVYYESPDPVRISERKELFEYASNRLKSHNLPAIASEQYVRDFYDIIFQPHIIDEHGEKLTDKEVITNMRNLIIFTHCHGSAVVQGLQEILASDMKKYGYSPAIIKKAMKNVLVIQHAPMTPIHNQLFNIVSFMSAGDAKINMHNQFSDYVSQHSADVEPSYFTDGNFFTTFFFTDKWVQEHMIIGLVPNTDQEKLTPGGALIMAAERNAIVNGARNVANGGAPLDISELISPASESDEIKPDFNELKVNGDNFVALMKQDIKRFRHQTNR